MVPPLQILPTKMSYSANLKNVMSMASAQRAADDQPMAEQEMEAPKPGPSPHDLAAQLKSSLLAEIGLTESDGPPLPSFRYGRIRAEGPRGCHWVYTQTCSDILL